MYSCVVCLYVTRFDCVIVFEFQEERSLKFVV